MYEFLSLTINRRMSLVSGIISEVFGESERAGARTVIQYWAGNGALQLDADQAVCSCSCNSSSIFFVNFDQ